MTLHAFLSKNKRKLCTITKPKGAILVVGRDEKEETMTLKKIIMDIKWVISSVFLPMRKENIDSEQYLTK